MRWRFAIGLAVLAALALAAFAFAAKSTPPFTSPAYFQARDYLFNEQRTAGTVSATLKLPAASRLLGFNMRGVNDWADTGATLRISDETATYFACEEAFASDRDGGWINDTPGIGDRPHGIYYPDGQIITMTYTTTVSTSTPTGQTRVELIYATGLTTTQVP